MGMTAAEGLDPRYYTDPEIFARELESIFAHTWQLVGHESQIASPGQLTTVRVGNESVILANDDGVISGFYNVCQHRGHQLIADGAATDIAAAADIAADIAAAGGAAATMSSITCPYHAWSYGLDGRLLHARGEEVGDLCVPKVRVDSMSGFLFVNLDLGAPSLEETVPGVAAELEAIAPDAAERKLTWRRSHLIRANWKVAVENYNECYHCPNVHKTFTAGVVTPGSYRIAPRGFTIHHTAQGPPPDRSAYTRQADSSEYGAFYTWPVSSIQCYPGRVLNTFRWVPLAVDQTLLIREWWFDRTEPTPEQAEVIALDWDTTVSEDFEIMDSVQQGMASRGYRPGPLIVDPSGVAGVHAENAVPHLHRLLLDALADQPHVSQAHADQPHADQAHADQAHVSQTQG
ncbi:MAG: aromatic ring-hydroxylating dioxygenase subunit alpha [Acidimicrobiaceae bacterium]|nr:aromatic ring-hydroxylating dioxygenase subunit alpha [Acidimicrobiaceae bacterium]